MIIEKINVKSFGMLTDTTMEFSDAVNVIEGQNESGKSTIAAFIRYMLYGFDSAPERDTLSERKKRINWATGCAQGSMTVRVGKKRYLISRSTVMSEGAPTPTYKEDCSITDLETGTPAFGKSPAGEVFFGVGRELFENTAFIGSLGDAKINEEAVTDAIENILFSGSEKLSSRKALEKINDKMESLLHQGGTGGIIVDLVHKEDELRAELDRANESNRNILQKEAELHEIRSRKSAAEAKMQKLVDLDSCHKNVMLIQQFDRLHELEKECEAKTEALNAFLSENAKGGYTPDRDYLTDLSVSRGSLADAEEELREAEKTVAEKNAEIGITGEIENAIALCDTMQGESNILAEANTHQRRRGVALAGTIVSALALLFGIILEIVAQGSLASTLFRVLFGVLGGIGLVGLIVSLVVFGKSGKKLTALCAKFGTTCFADLYAKISHIADARNKRDASVRESNLAATVLERAKSRYDSAATILTNFVLKWSGTIPEGGDPTVFLDELEARVKTFLAEKEEKQSERDNLDATIKEIRRNLSDVSEIDIRAQVSPLRRKALAEIDHDAILSEIDECKKKIAEEEDAAKHADDELTALKADARDPGELVSRIRVLDDRIEELKDRHKSYYLAHKVIETASAELRTEISPRLGGYTTNMMSTMTEKKYDDLDVSDGLKVTFRTDAGERRPVDFLSGGTQDLTYIAVRLALIDMLYSEKPPVTFDESFAHQDNNRAASMMRAIKRLSDEGQQSFVFTCRSREASLAGDFVNGAAFFKLQAAEQ